MGHMYHILLADGAVVEPLSDVVAGGANQLHAALEVLGGMAERQPTPAGTSGEC